MMVLNTLASLLVLGLMIFGFLPEAFSPVVRHVCWCRVANLLGLNLASKFKRLSKCVLVEIILGEFFVENSASSIYWSFHGVLRLQVTIDTQNLHGDLCEFQRTFFSIKSNSSV